MGKKRIVIGILLLAAVYLGYRGYDFAMAPKTQLAPMDMIPGDAVFVLESEQPLESWEQIAQGKALMHLEKKGYLARLTQNIQKVDKIFDKNSGLWAGSPLFFSLHMISPEDYGVLCVLDLDGISKMELVKTYWNSLFDREVTRHKRTYQGHEILEVSNRERGETMVLAFVHDKLLVSNAARVIEASIDQYRRPSLGRDPQFLEIEKLVGRESLFRLYLQFDRLDDYIEWYTGEPSQWARGASAEFGFTGFHFFLDGNNTFTANGFTNIRAKKDPYLEALQKSGRAPRGIHHIAPLRTGLYISYGFRSFADFYGNYESIQQRNPAQFATFEREVEQLEGLLDIDLKKNIVPWIGEEIALLQIQSKISKGGNELALVLKANDVTQARDALDFIMERVRKKTPVKFKTVDYKGHQIKFLTLKGFFKILFKGKFSEIDKPYFTLIDQYVIFSESPNTLKGIIDDVVAGQTLGASVDYRAFEGNFEEESTVFVYSNVPLLYHGLYAWVEGDTRQRLEENRELIQHFPQFGFQLDPKDGIFRTRMVVNYRDLPPGVEPLASPPGDGVTKAGAQGEVLPTEAIFQLPPIYPSDLTADRFVVRYANGNIRFEVELKDGLKHGWYTQYHPNGKRKIRGRFRADEQVGDWRYFDAGGSLLLRKNF